MSGLFFCLFIAGTVALNAQVKILGPPPVKAPVARQRIRKLLKDINRDNRQQTVKALFDLATWYRDVLDEELIAAWRGDGRENLTDVMDTLADSRVATDIIEFSWRQQRQATFTPDYAPVLGILMAHHPESAKPFFDDLLAFPAPDLSEPEAEAVCQILIEMPDVRTWNADALRILPHYRQTAESLLQRDAHSDDQDKRYRALRLLADLRKDDSPPDMPRRPGTATPPRLMRPSNNGASARQPAQAVAPASVAVRPDGLRYVWISPGAFTMGCSEGDRECSGNEKPHSARIANGFWLGQTEVTQAAYQRVTGSNPSTHRGDELPVESVTWNEAVNYCEAIGGRLPSEAEWEYAARAGSAPARYGSLDAIAWYAGNSGGISQPVARKQPNAFGLYDMLGNVWEWVSDSYGGGGAKVVRGGAWSGDPRFSRVSYRTKVEPSLRNEDKGFRCAVDGSGSSRTGDRH